LLELARGNHRRVLVLGREHLDEFPDDDAVRDALRVAEREFPAEHDDGR
jgi:hypothetical protein